MYYVRDTGSRLFGEAYFVLREGLDGERIRENDLAAEADRILRERFFTPKRRWRRPRLVSVGLFVLGALIGAVLAGWVI